MFLVVLAAPLCPTCFCMDCSLRVPSVHRTSQARVPEQIAISFSEDLPDREACLLQLQVDALHGASRQGPDHALHYLNVHGETQEAFRMFALWKIYMPVHTWTRKHLPKVQSSPSSTSQVVSASTVVLFVNLLKAVSTVFLLSLYPW